MIHRDFNAAFRDGTEFVFEDKGDRRTYPVEVRRVGSLRLPTGRVVACDPFVFPERPPYTVTAPTGRFPVYISIARVGTGKSHDERIACAMVRFNPRVPVRYKMALIRGQAARTLKDDEYFGYGVDAGLGCFMDVETGRALVRKMKATPDYYEEIMAELKKTYKHTREWADLPVDGDRAHNLVVFSSGWGDGSYPSFWGYDRHGELARLVTDFHVLPWADDADQ